MSGQNQVRALCRTGRWLMRSAYLRKYENRRSLPAFQEWTRYRGRPYHLRPAWPEAGATTLHRRSRRSACGLAGLVFSQSMIIQVAAPRPPATLGTP